MKPPIQTSGVSIVIATRNDGFEGNPMDRLREVLHEILRFRHATGASVEILVVDGGSEIPVRDAINLRHPCLRYLYVDKEVFMQLGTPFSEVHLLNYGARKATQPWIARLDQDTIPGQEFFADFLPKISHTNEAYFSMRRDLPEGTLNLAKAALNSPLDFKPYWHCAVGVLLVPTTTWHRLRGYDEAQIHRNHMEHEFICRLRRVCGVRNASKRLDCCFYHIWHTRTTKHPENEFRPEEVLMKLPVIANLEEDWGLQKAEQLGLAREL